MHFTLRSKALYFALFSGISYGIYRWATSGRAPEAADEPSSASPGAALGIPGAALAPLPPRTAFTTPQALLALLQEAAAASAGMAASGGAGDSGRMRLTALRVCLAPPGCPPAEAAAALPGFLQKLQQFTAQPDGAVEVAVALEPSVYDALRAAGGAPRAETCVPGIVGADMLATSAALAGGDAAQPWSTSAGTHLTAPEHAGAYCGAPSLQLPSAAGGGDKQTAGHVLVFVPEGPAGASVLKQLKGALGGWFAPPLWEAQPAEVPLAQLRLHPAGGAFVSSSPQGLQLHAGQTLLEGKAAQAVDEAPAPPAWWYAPSAGQLALVLGQEG